MLSAFIGSVFNGLFSGFWIAFFTGWISWLAFIRILAAGCYELYLAFENGTNFRASLEGNGIQYSSIGMVPLNPSGAAEEVEKVGTNPTEGNTNHHRDEESPYFQSSQLEHHLNSDPDNNTIDPRHQHLMNQLNRQPKQSRICNPMPKSPTRDVHAFGWLGWIWSAIYTPISHSIWLFVHIDSTRGALLLVRALAIAVSALGLTFDYKARYGAKLSRGWLYFIFNIWNSLACILLGAEATVLLVKGFLNLDSEISLIPFAVIYPVFSVIWAVASWRFLPPIDAARPGVNSEFPLYSSFVRILTVYVVFVDVAMGAFAGLFVAAPAFGLWQSSKFDEGSAANRAAFGFSNSDSGTTDGVGLSEFLSCGVSVLEKWAAFMP
jgi:hypothetical protein